MAYVAAPVIAPPDTLHQIGVDAADAPEEEIVHRVFRLFLGREPEPAELSEQVAALLDVKARADPAFGDYVYLFAQLYARDLPPLAARPAIVRG